MCLTLPDSDWKQWYRLNHRDAYERRSGEEFEHYVTSVLEFRYRDFIDPDPMGQLGDGGCDGLADNGRILFACYGQRAQSNQDEKTKNKICHDFQRAIEQWPDFSEWVFITNAQIGPSSAKLVTELRRRYSLASDRPLNIFVIKTEGMFWDRFVSRLTTAQLNALFPGVPHAQNVELADLVELIDSIRMPTDKEVRQQNMEIRPVSIRKMDFNNIPETTRIELNEGRILSPEIDKWFSEQINPELRDDKAIVFHGLYEKARQVTDDPAEIMERIYIAIGGSDYRLDRGRANAVYAIASYFFDSCDIFEGVPEGN